MTSASILCLVLALVAKPVMAEKGCYSVSQSSEYWVSNYGTALPTDPHYSGMVLTMHTDQYTMSAVNKAATAGVQSISETGKSTTLQAEITASSAAMGSTKVPPTNLTGQATKLGFADFMMEADSNFPHVSLITMIAPSPDWFAFGSAMLFENGAFQTKAVDLYAYDAGTDSGTMYTSANNETSPKGVITELMSGVTGANAGVRKMMTMTFTPKCCYTVTQDSEKWVEMYNTSLPADPHYSGMMVATHTSGYSMSAVGAMASAGLQMLAETGKSDTLITEVMGSASTSQMCPVMAGCPVPPTKLTGQATKLGFADFRMAATKSNPHVSVATMIAPSPDWYAFGSTMLVETDQFMTTTVSLYAYDAGTDSGTDYTSSDLPTNPQESISDLMGGVTGASTTGKRLMMTMKFTPDASHGGCLAPSSASASSSGTGGGAMISNAYAPLGSFMIHIVILSAAKMW